MKMINKMYPDTEIEIVNINSLYFTSLYKKFQSGVKESLVLKDSANNSKVIPLPIASSQDLAHIEIKDYSSLKEDVSLKLKNYGIRILKMQAGLGTSVERLDLIKKYDNRTTLGSKGTDLFVEVDGHTISIAEAQLLKAEKIEKKKIYKYVAFQNLINSETELEVNKIWNRAHIREGISYNEIFSTEYLKRCKEVFQLMMPTIDERLSLTIDRVAPAGHAFLGFSEIYRIFKSNELEDEIIVIGNGEDLQSTTDERIHSWIADNDVPIAMITTTKTRKDKKGGQIAIVNEDRPYVTIVEKAQAEEAGQLDLFEELGLRETDERSLFNTNIVVINQKALKTKLNKLDISGSEFMDIIGPDLIENRKEQCGKKFIQLEGAIGSTLLNLDKYYRKNSDSCLIHFLNLDESEREMFFVPIKKREDFERIDFALTLGL